MAEMQGFTNTSVFRNFGKEEGMSDEPQRNGLVGRRHAPGSETGGLRFRGDALERSPLGQEVVAYGRSGSPILEPAYGYCSLRQKEVSVGAIIDTTRTRWNLDDTVRELSCCPNAGSDGGIGGAWLRGRLVW